MTDVTLNATMAVPASYPTTAAMDVIAMRHKTFDPSTLGEVDAIEIISQPSIGRVVLQDNNTIVVNLDGIGQITGSTSFEFRVTRGADTTNCTMDVSILASEQSLGWGDGLQYFHPVDPISGRWSLLRGEGWQTWYVDSVTGMTRADIASDAGVGTSTVTGNWLVAQYPAYGGSEGSALAIDAAIELHKGMPDRGAREFLFKKGGDYSALQEEFGKRGISGIYPSVISSYGTGIRPVIRGTGRTFGGGAYSLHEDVALTASGSFSFVTPGPLMALNMFTGGSHEFNFQKTPHLTVMNSKIIDVTRSTPSGGASDWSDAFANRSSGIYVAECDGSAFLNNFLDHCGWADGYLPSAAYNAGANGCPPNAYGHNIYAQGDCRDQAFIGNISTRASSQGIQFRSGGMDIYNLAFMNPISGNTLGKGRSGKTPGLSNYTITYRGVATQGFQHSPSMSQNDADGGVYADNHAGAQQRGQNWSSYQQSIYQSMVVHNSDPNDPFDTNKPSDLGIRREVSDIASGGRGPFIDGSSWLIYGWREPDSATLPLADNSGNLDTASFEANGTIQQYQDTRFSRAPGTTTGAMDLINDLRSMEDFRGQAEEINDFLIDAAAAAGKADFVRPAIRTVAQTVKAVLEPNGLTSGKWWNMPLDWETGDYPGFVDNDNANLQGHRFYSQIQKAIVLNDLDLGEGGGVTVSASSIRVTGTLSAGSGGGHIGATVSGRMLFNGYSGSEQITAGTEGGILINEGTIAGNMDITVACQQFPAFLGMPFNAGYTLLAKGGESCTFGAGDTLDVQGYGIAALDGINGAATVNFDPAAMLRFTAVGNANANNPYRFGVLREFQTGFFGDTPPNITSVVNLNGVPVEIDATGMSAGTYVVLDVDTLNGALGAVTVTGGTASIAKVGNTLEITI